MSRIEEVRKKFENGVRDADTEPFYLLTEMTTSSLNLALHSVVEYLYSEGYETTEEILLGHSILMRGSAVPSELVDKYLRGYDMFETVRENVLDNFESAYNQIAG